MKWVIFREKRIVTVICCMILTAVVFVITFHTTAVAAAYGENTPNPIRCVQTKQKIASLTFDVDAGDLETRKILEVLGRYRVKSTFFVVGAWAEKNQESLKELASAGHEIGNHSNTHPHMKALPQQEILEQMHNCNLKIQRATGVTPAFFRPPYGETAPVVAEAAQSLHMTCILWSVDSMDWGNLPPGKIAERVVTTTEPGSIVLFHCGAKNTAAALPKILDTLQAQGYKFVPVSQLMYREPYTVSSSGVQISLQIE